MFYEIDEQLDQCTNHAMHNSTLTKLLRVRKIRVNIISHLKWLFQVLALKLEGMNRIVCKLYLVSG